MNEYDLDADRTDTTNEIAGSLYQLSKAAKHLTLQQRVMLADVARDLADAFDNGRVLMPSDKRPKRHFIRTAHVGNDGAPLFS